MPSFRTSFDVGHCDMAGLMPSSGHRYFQTPKTRIQKVLMKHSLPNHLLHPHRLRPRTFRSSSISLQAYQNRTICFTPILTFCAIVPNDSKVFRVVEGGSVKRLKKLLSSGEASLGDCDPLGRSLLNVSLCEDVEHALHTLD